MTRPGESQLTFDHINKVKTLFGIKRLLYLLRIYIKLAGEKKKQKSE
jgi:hypothetical protein